MAEGVLNEYDWSVDDMGRESIRVDPEALCPRLCRTVHKSQGLEYDEVVFVQTSSTPIWTLSKNLNYTAYSRAKRKLYLVGSLQMFNGRSARREARRQNTYIAEWLSSGRVEEPTVREIESEGAVEARLVSEIEEASLATEVREELTSVTADYRAVSRRRLPKRVRYDVWDRYIGANKTRGRCYVYSGHEVTYHTFHVGHVRSVARGGSDALSNLRVICACCNSSMGVQDLEEYRRSYYGGEEGGSVVL